MNSRVKGLGVGEQTPPNEGVRRPNLQSRIKNDSCRRLRVRLTPRSQFLTFSIFLQLP